MNTPTLRSYSHVVAAITYSAPWLARGEVAAMTDDLGAIDTYGESEGPATERDDGCPVTVRSPKSGPVTERAIVVSWQS